MMRTTTNKSLKNFRISFIVIAVTVTALFSCEEVEIIPVEEVPSPIEGVNYYRLKQVDFDGTVSYHDIMSTQVDGSENGNRNGRTLAVNGTSVQSGAWDNSSTWQTGTPMPFTLPQNANVTIEEGHSVKASQNIVIAKNSTVTIKKNATLDVITYEVAKDGEIKVEEGATLIMRGDFTSAKNLNIDSKGTLIVMGEVDIAKDAVIQNNGNIYFADPTPNIDGSVNWSGATAGDMDDLANDFPSLFSTLPITIAWQEATTLIDGTVMVAFETAEEQNSDYVVIQWSVDAETWSDVEKISSNNKPSYYDFIHR